MPASAKQAFRKTLQRVEGVLALHSSLHGTPGRPQQQVSDVLRGALVLATAALDALVLDSMAEAVPTLARTGKLGAGVATWVKKDGATMLGFFAEDDPCAALGDYCRLQLGPRTFQKASMIETTLAEIVGCEPPWDRAAVALTRNGDAWTGEQVRDRLDVYVLRRNRIAHAGDLKAGGGRLATEPIQLRFVEDATRVIRAVGDAVSAVITARLRSRTRP